MAGGYNSSASSSSSSSSSCCTADDAAGGGSFRRRHTQRRFGNHNPSHNDNPHHESNHQRHQHKDNNQQRDRDKHGDEYSTRASVGANNLRNGGAPYQSGNARCADYFAILGVGDSLRLKAQQTCRPSLIQPAEEQEQEQEEEECRKEGLLVERFYREIVRVDLISAENHHHPPSSQSRGLGGLASSPRMLQPRGLQPPAAPLSPHDNHTTPPPPAAEDASSTTTGGTVRKAVVRGILGSTKIVASIGGGVEGVLLANRRAQPKETRAPGSLAGLDNLPSASGVSPATEDDEVSHSTGIFSMTSSHASFRTHATSSVVGGYSAVTRAEMDGFQVLKYTLPTSKTSVGLARAAHGQGHAHAHGHGHGHGESSLMDSALDNGLHPGHGHGTETAMLGHAACTVAARTVMGSSSHHHPSHSSSANPKGDVWDANLHPFAGLRRDVLLYKSGHFQYGRRTGPGPTAHQIGRGGKATAAMAASAAVAVVHVAATASRSVTGGSVVGSTTGVEDGASVGGLSVPSMSTVKEGHPPDPVGKTPLKLVRSGASLLTSRLRGSSSSVVDSPSSSSAAGVSSPKSSSLVLGGGQMHHAFGAGAGANRGLQVESNSSYYVAYRRRLPDEEQVPAIANVRIMYAQVHRMSLISSVCKVPFSLGGPPDKNHDVDAEEEEGDDDEEDAPPLLTEVLKSQLPQGYHELVLPFEYRSMQVQMQAQEGHAGGAFSFMDHDGQSSREGLGADASHVGDREHPHGSQPLRSEDRRSQRRHENTLIVDTTAGGDTHTPCKESTAGAEHAMEEEEQEEEGVEAVVDPTKAYAKTPSPPANKRTCWVPRLVESPPLLESMYSGDQHGSASSSSAAANSHYAPSSVVAAGSLSPMSCRGGHTHPHHHHPHGSEGPLQPSSPSPDAGLIFFPVLCIRRIRCGNEERFHEDPAMVDLAMTYKDENGEVELGALNEATAREEEEEEDEDEDGGENAGGMGGILQKSKWTSCVPPPSTDPSTNHDDSRDEEDTPLVLGEPVLIRRNNLPLGLCDLPYGTSVLFKFPSQEYENLPFLEEELPMFCYPAGCMLKRSRYGDGEAPKCYGFVVKNERGDSIYVSCVSFMEPLTWAKQEQLEALSYKRRRTSLPHRHYWQRRRRKQRAAKRKEQHGSSDSVSDGTYSTTLDDSLDSNLSTFDDEDDDRMCNDTEEVDFARYKENFYSDFNEDDLLTGFEEMVTYENKTICIIGRYPYWTAFRRFLLHLHLLSGSASTIPLERCISHLLLSVPTPKPGGSCIIVPLPALSGPMVLSMPPNKDLPLVDLSYERLFGCLDIPSVVTIVLGFLALERGKVILMSSHPCLVTDICELLRSLLFPFELCAPYVPRLTQPFMSCLEFPGAIFAGIHDDGSADGLAATIRENFPEESAIVNLDTGDIDCTGDKYEVLKQCWGVIPSGPRTALVSEIETLCRNAGLVPGQEPIEGQGTKEVNASIPLDLVEDNEAREPLDDRGVRDAFLRFFCTILSGYELHLVVPDMDFLVSGNEWFDTKGFLGEVTQDRAAFLNSLLSTQLFQSFVQRRTEASDVHCMLFDECLEEFHSSSATFGPPRDHDPNKSANAEDNLFYDLLIDQCTPELSVNHLETSESHDFLNMDNGERVGLTINVSTEGSEAGTSVSALGFGGLGASRLSSALALRGGGSKDLNLENGVFITNADGDIVTAPFTDNLPSYRFLYCIDGNPCFPHKLDNSLFMPSAPESLSTTVSQMHVPVLTRSDREIEDANRRRKLATSHQGSRRQRRCLWQLPKLMASHALGAWLMCIPSQVAQPGLSPAQQSRYLVRALGALRLVRFRQRVIPDEAAYRALIVACGRSNSDRRVELVKLFGLLRSEGIFPSAVTLGQYTRAIAEGYSRRSFGTESVIDIDEPPAKTGVVLEHLDSLDEHLAALEESGKSWRRRKRSSFNGVDNQDGRNAEAAEHLQKQGNEKAGSRDSEIPPIGQGSRPAAAAKRIQQRPWIPIMTSSAFAPREELKPCKLREKDVRLVALWSRVTPCDACSYVPLDEELMAGCDLEDASYEVQGAIPCPRCGSPMTPLIGYQILEMAEALGDKQPGENARSSFTSPSNSAKSSSFSSASDSNKASLLPKVRGKALHSAPHKSMSSVGILNQSEDDNLKDLPPQMRPISNVKVPQKGVDRSASDDQGDQGCCDDTDEEMSGFVPYMNPFTLRMNLDRAVEENGEVVLERDSLRKLDPGLFYNLWWYSARFQLPLPLPIQAMPKTSNATDGGDCGDSQHKRRAQHYCAFVSWDQTLAVQGCKAGAIAIKSLIVSQSKRTKPLQENHEAAQVAPPRHNHLLSAFNLQTYAQSDWEHEDLSKILVELVTATNEDKRDLRFALDAVRACNRRRSDTNMHRLGGNGDTTSGALDNDTMSEGECTFASGASALLSGDMDCYRTLLYLVRYQCTTAFHVFFPTVAKPCKGYHFWCVSGTPMPIFDRMYRNALSSSVRPVAPHTSHEVSDIALAFRSIFGHII